MIKYILICLFLVGCSYKEGEDLLRGFGYDSVSYRKAIPCSKYEVVKGGKGEIVVYCRPHFYKQMKLELKEVE